MTLAAKHMDPVVGIDMHMVQPPPPAPPVMLPVPFVGYLIDPADYAGGCTIHVNGLPRARAGTPGMGCPPHVPPGGMFVKPPTNECEMYQGSSTVVFDGDAASAMGHQVLGCHDVGMVAPVRGWKQAVAKSLMMGSCSVVPISSSPVMINGTPAITVNASSTSDVLDKPKSPLGTVSIEVINAFGDPYANQAFELRLPNGDVEQGSLDQRGTTTICDVPSGHVILFLEGAMLPLVPARFPPLADPASTTARPGPVNTVDGSAIAHIVQPGETLRSIALRYGIADLLRLRHNPANGDLLEARPNPNILLPGDVVNITQPEHPAIQYRNTGTPLRTPGNHVVFLEPRQILLVDFRSTGPFDWSHAPWAPRYDQSISGGNLDAEGILAAAIPMHKTRLELEISPRFPNGTPAKLFFTLRLGHLDPPTDQTGAVARLRALGYLHGSSPTTRESYARALKKFQADYDDLEVSGTLDEATATKLVQKYRS